MGKKIIILCVCLFSLFACANNEKPKTKIKKEAIKEPTEYQYFYSKLNKKEKKCYLELYEAILKSESGITINNISEEKINTIIGYILADHPEIFWSEGYATCYEEDVDKNIEVYPIYNALKGEKKSTKKKLEKIRDEIVSSIQAESDYDKVKAVYDYVIQNTEYVEGSQYNQSIMGAMLNKQTVCAGYAKTVQYLLKALGVDSTYIAGTTVKNPTDSAEPVRHAWNMVKVNGDYFYLDATWGDVVSDFPHTCYNYFLMSADEMLQTHVPNDAYEMTSNPGESYSLKNGTYITECNYQVFSNLWLKAINEGRNYIEFKCSPDIYAEVDYYITQSQNLHYVMFDLGLNSQIYYYSRSENGYSFDVYY